MMDHRYEYPVRILEDEDPETGYWVVSRDIPEMNTIGFTREEAFDAGKDGLVSALSIYVDTRRPIPESSASREGEVIIALPALAEAKVILWNAMQEKTCAKLTCAAY